MTNTERVTFSMIVVQLLLQRLVELGMTQKDFLQASGISQATWSRISRGLSSFSIEDLRGACRAVGLAYSDLIAQAEQVEAGLPQMDVQVVRTTGPSDAAKFAGTFLAGAALAFLIGRIRRP
jgi:transcriptional regulator with XRE-family HTH domain